MFIEFFEMRDARVVEEARLESVYTPKVYRGFESRSPLNVLDRNGQQTDKKLQINDLLLFLLPESPASKTSKVRKKTKFRY